MSLVGLATFTYFSTVNLERMAKVVGRSSLNSCSIFYGAAKYCLIIIDPFATVETKAQAAAGDKVKHRLEQLDDLEEGSVKETLNLGQKEYVKKIDDLNKSLIAAWDNDQRVKALKIAIQVRREKFSIMYIDA